MQTLQEIKEIVKDNRYDEAIYMLDEYLKIYPADDEAYFLRGNIYIKLGDMRNAINDYCQAREINPESPASEAYNAIQDILNFYNTDLYNP